MKWNEIFARKIQPKHETQSPFSDETRNLIHYPLFSKKSAQDFSFQNYSKPKTLREKFSQNMKRKDVFQILPLNMKRNPLCTCKNCIKNASYVELLF